MAVEEGQSEENTLLLNGGQNPMEGLRHRNYGRLSTLMLKVARDLIRLFGNSYSGHFSVKGASSRKLPLGRDRRAGSGADRA